MKENSIIISDKLSQLIKYSGSVIFAIGDYYVQFAKDKSEKTIFFEAVSHNFLDILPKNVDKDFVDLGFKIQDGNYYKNVRVESKEIIVTDVEKIFQDIYKVNYEKSFSITDDIEYSVKEESTVSNVQSNLNSPKQKSSNLKTVIILAVIAVAVYLLFFYHEKREVGNYKTEACIISQEFVKRQLLSPKSADFGNCSESKVVHLGNDRYQITNSVDASNGFGAIITKTYSAIVRYNGGQWEDDRNWTLESINIQ